MPPEIFRGREIAALLARAQQQLGADAVVVAVRRVRTARGTEMELTAAPGTERASIRHAAPAVWRDAQRCGMTLAPAAGGPRIVTLVGPTGAGKTTTIAKLANHPQVFGTRAVGLLCLDTYRVGAVDQSKAYAELSNLPLEVAYEASEIPDALRRLRGCEIVLVDTAGRGPRRIEDKTAVLAQLRALGSHEVHFVVPAGLDPRHARRLLAAHWAHGLTHVLPTKLDECPNDDSAFALAAEYRLPLRWMGDGQEVPRDLHAAAPAALAALRRNAAEPRLEAVAS